MLSTIQTILSLVGVAILCIVSFHVTVYILKLYKGYTHEEAVKKIQDFFKNKDINLFEYNTALFTDIS